MTYSAWKEGGVDNQCACGGRVCVHRYQLESLEIILRSHLLEKMVPFIKRKKVLEMFFQTKYSRYLYYETFGIFKCQCHYELLIERHKDVVHSTLNRLYFEN